jgi:two-component system, NtrC family, response regulator HydG
MTDPTHEIWNLRFANQIIQAMSDGVFTMDPTGRITSWNPSMERISGYTAREALGQTCALLQCSRCFGKECPTGIRYCGIIEQGHAEVKECMLRHKNGHDIPVIKNASVVKMEGGKIIGVVETVTDMTELIAAREKAEAATERLNERHRLGNIIGKSPAMRKVFASIRAAADSDATILVQGESGTGKELVAGAIHFNSSRRSKPLVTVNCSALSESLLESELFGHIRGAYTGAISDRMGRFEEAQGGTLFLDEIGELSPLIQVKLLRVLQERQIERVGESKKRCIDIRVITATHQDVLELMRQNRFREDLYYRLKVFPIHLPPLRERKEDIPLLLDHFIKRMNRKTSKRILRLSPAAMRICMDFDWRGNVRELENAIEHAFVLCNQSEIEPADLPREIRRLDPAYAKMDGAASNPTRRTRLTKQQLLDLLTETGWNKLETGRRVGLSHTAIWKYMKKWEIPLKRPVD